MDLLDAVAVVSVSLGAFAGFVTGMISTFFMFRHYTCRYARQVVDAFKSEIEWEAETVPADA